MDVTVGEQSQEEASTEIVAQAQRFEMQMNDIINSIAADGASPFRLREAITELAELGQSLRSEFERAYQEEMAAAGGDRQAVLKREISELEASLKAKDALLERYARKVGEWQRTFAQLAQQHDEEGRS